MRAAWICLLAASACSSDLAFLSNQGLASLLLIEIDPSNTAQVTAYDLTLGPVKLTAPQHGSVYALGYAATLDALGLAPGPIAVGGSGDLLPASEKEYRLDGAAWVQLSVRPAEVAALHLTHRCLQLSATRRTFPRMGGESATFALPLDEARVLVGTDSGRFYQITQEATTERTLDAPYLGGIERDGELWLVGPGARFAHGHPDRGFVPGPALPFPLSYQVTVTGSPSPQPFELFVTDASLAVAHFDGVAWRQVRPPSPMGPVRTSPSIAWAEPGLAALTGTELDIVVEVDVRGTNRDVMLELPPRSDVDGWRRAGFVEGIGAIVGSYYGGIHRRATGGTWTLLEVPPLTPSIDVIIDLGDRSFLAGGEDGIFFQWKPDGRVCPAITGLSDANAEQSSRLGSGLAIIGKPDATSYNLYLVSGLR